MYRGATLYSCKDLPNMSILTEKFKNKEIENIEENMNTGKKMNLPTTLRDVENKNERLVGVIEFSYQARLNKRVPYQVVPTRCTFILSPNEKILAILGRGTDVPDVKHIITRIIDDTQKKVQYFTNLEILPDKMYKLALRVRKSYKKNWCDRPRFSHENRKYDGHVFNDYSNGLGNCVFDSKKFAAELKNCSGFSPIVKFFKCEKLDPNLTNKPKTIKFKQEGQIATSQPYDFEDWEDFIFNLVVPSIK